MSMCGYTNLRDTGSFLPDQTTVYDWLLDHQVRWRVYSAGLPFFLLMPRLAPLVLTSHFCRLGDLPTDLATEAPGDRPQVIFIDPTTSTRRCTFRRPVTTMRRWLWLRARLF